MILTCLIRPWFLRTCLKTEPNWSVTQRETSLYMTIGTLLTVIYNRPTVITRAAYGTHLKEWIVLCILLLTNSVAPRFPLIRRLHSHASTSPYLLWMARKWTSLTNLVSIKALMPLRTVTHFLSTAEKMISSSARNKIGSALPKAKVAMIIISHPAILTNMLFSLARRTVIPHHGKMIS